VDDYRAQYEAIVANAIENHEIASREALARFAKEAGEQGKPFIDKKGAPWLEIDEDGKAARVGISLANVLAPGSNRDLAFKLMLAHISETLKAPPHQRETMPEFQVAWNLMQQARPVERNSLAMGR